MLDEQERFALLKSIREDFRKNPQEHGPNDFEINDGNEYA